MANTIEKPTAVSAIDEKRWFVMRDLKRRNAKLPAYMLLESMGLEIFTPMVWKLSVRKGVRNRERVPYVQDLLFVNESRRKLDPIVEEIPTLQYRYIKGGNGQPMMVRTVDMERFMKAVNSTETPRFYSPSEITPAMIGRKVRIVGGALDGYECNLLKLRGARTKRIIVELPNMLVTSVEVEPEFIQLL